MTLQASEVRAVVSHFQRMLGDDGTTVELQSVEGGLVRVRYKRGDCDTCHLPPADLAVMIEELLRKRGEADPRVAVDEVTVSRAF